MKCPKCGRDCDRYMLGYQCGKCSYSWAASRAGLDVWKTIQEEKMRCEDGN